LVIVPHRSLHYLPFHALHDGAAYLIETREISYAPSASILLHCMQREVAPLDDALLLGIPDEATPQVRGEIEAIHSLFPAATVLHDDTATLAALRAHAPSASLLHLACHGQFRPDSPLFSSLQLADGWLTVRDAAQLPLRCGLVTLSACETGLNTVAPGDELLGLTRGFFSAGAPALLVSLWKVADESTARLMKDFYARVQQGQNLSAALRAAQCALLRETPHPYFWAPFTLSGRW
jgi:CHAT domain-containing protein